MPQPVVEFAKVTLVPRHRLGCSKESRMLCPRCTSSCQRHSKDHRFKKHLLCRNERRQDGSMPPLKACHLNPAYNGVWKSMRSCGHCAGDLRQCEDCFLAQTSSLVQPHFLFPTLLSAALHQTRLEDFTLAHSGPSDKKLCSLTSLLPSEFVFSEEPVLRSPAANVHGTAKDSGHVGVSFQILALATAQEREVAGELKSLSPWIPALIMFWDAQDRGHCQ